MGERTRQASPFATRKPLDAMPPRPAARDLAEKDAARERLVRELHDAARDVARAVRDGRDDPRVRRAGGRIQIQCARVLADIVGRFGNLHDREDLEVEWRAHLRRSLEELGWRRDATGWFDRPGA